MLTIEDTGNALATLTGDNPRSAIRRLCRAVISFYSPSKKARQRMKELGICGRKHGKETN